MLSRLQVFFIRCLPEWQNKYSTINTPLWRKSQYVAWKRSWSLNLFMFYKCRNWLGQCTYGKEKINIILLICFNYMIKIFIFVGSLDNKKSKKSKKIENAQNGRCFFVQRVLVGEQQKQQNSLTEYISFRLDCTGWQERWNVCFF